MEHATLSEATFPVTVAPGLTHNGGPEGDLVLYDPANLQCHCDRLSDPDARAGRALTPSFELTSLLFALLEV